MRSIAATCEGQEGAVQEEQSLQSPLRVLHAPTTVGGNPQQLAKAERALGLDSRSVVLSQNQLNQGADQVLWSRGDGILRRELKKLFMIFRALRYDIIHLDFGSTISAPAVPPDAQARGLRRLLWWCFWFYGVVLERTELTLYRLFRIPVFVTYQGDDARQGDYCLKHFEITMASEIDSHTPVKDAYKRRRIARLDRFATKIYALNPDLLHVLPSRAEFLPYANVDVHQWTPVATSNPRPRVIHAPSDRGAKGTRFIMEAVQRLHSEGVDFDFQLIEGIPNAEVKRIYAGADLLVDQLLAGWYGGLAVELMALGKPVICYIRQPDLKFIPREMRDELPIVNATSDTIYRVLRECLTTRRHELKALGERSRAYVEKWHDPLQIAARLKRDYQRALNS